MNNDKSEKFVALLSENQRKIFAYILCSVCRRNVADEIMQQTLLLMWRNFSRFEPGTNFSAWGKEIARYEIFSYRKRNARGFFLDLDAIEKIMGVSKDMDKASNQRINALDGCLKKLSDKNRNLIYNRYTKGHSCIKISEEMGRPVSTIYKTFARLHASLQDCIHRTLAVWDSQI